MQYVSYAKQRHFSDYFDDLLLFHNIPIFNKSQWSNWAAAVQCNPEMETGTLKSLNGVGISRIDLSLILKSFKRKTGSLVVVHCLKTCLYEERSV